MKILLITGELGYRGTPRFLANCAICAHGGGHDVLVWGMEEGGFAADLCKANGINVVIGRDREEEALAFAPAILHFHRAGWASEKENRLMASFKKRPCRILETSVFGAVDLTASNLIDLHAHISQWDLWRWRRWLWPLHQPGVLLPYCLDTNAFRPMPTEFRTVYHIPSDVFLVGRLGKTDWNILGNAMLHAMEKCPNVWFATVDDYSADPNSHPLFREFANRIVIIPRLNGADELSRFYSACDVTMNFSPIGESFGYGIAESMSCGTPAIVLSKPRNDNAQIELAAPEHGGFPVDSPHAAAQVILKLAAQHSLLDNARAKCRKSIEKRYSIVTVGPQLLKVYELLSATSEKGKRLERLFSDNGFTTHIPGREISRQLSQVQYPPTVGERLKTTIWNCLNNVWAVFKGSRWARA